MKLTYSVFLLFAAVGVYYAQAASLTRDTDVSDTSNASSDVDDTTAAFPAGNYSEVQKQDDETQETRYDDETQETRYGKSDLDTGVEEHTTVKGERAEQVTATMNVTATTSKESGESGESDVDPNIQGDIELLCNKSENKDRDTARQKRQHPEDPDYNYEYHYADNYPLADDTE